MGTLFISTIGDSTIDEHVGHVLHDSFWTKTISSHSYSYIFIRDKFYKNVIVKLRSNREVEWIT